ncbi:unnamed protein product [Chrysoparadoxa australica]
MAKQQNQECEVCEDLTRATHRCKDCGASLCRFHCEHHRMAIGTVTHKVVSLDEYRSECSLHHPSLARSRIACPRHASMPAKLFCKTCMAMICHDCAISDHHGHEYKLAEQEEGGARKSLVNQVEEGKEVLRRLTESLDEVQNVARLANLRKEDVKDAVKRTFTEMRRACDLREKELLDSLNDIKSSKTHALNRQLLELKDAALSMEHAVHIGSKVLQTVEGDQFVALVPSMESRVKDLKKQASKLKHEPCTDAKMAFKSDVELLGVMFKAVRKIGSFATTGSIPQVKEGPEWGDNAGEASPANPEETGPPNARRKPKQSAVYFSLTAENIGIVGAKHAHYKTSRSSKYVPAEDTVVVEVRGGSDAEAIERGTEGPLLGKVVLATRLDNGGSSCFESEQRFESMKDRSQQDPVSAVRFTKVLRFV